MKDLKRGDNVRLKRARFREDLGMAGVVVRAADEATVITGRSSPVWEYEVYWSNGSKSWHWDTHLCNIPGCDQCT